MANTLEPDYRNSDECKLMIERERISVPNNSPLLMTHSNSPQHNLTKNLSFPISCSQYCSPVPPNGSSCSPQFHQNQFDPLQIQANTCQVSLVFIAY